jgi:AhpD family alkylhydroperoxidase
MPRLQPVTPRGLDLIRRLTRISARRMYGRVLEPSEIIGHHRPSLLGYGAISLAAERYSHGVPRRLKSLAKLRAAQLVGCEWCLDFGSMLAVQSGVPEDDLKELSRWRSSERFDAVDKLVLEYTEAMTRTPVAVTDELFAQLRQRFDPAQIVELTMAISVENLYCRTNWALGIEGAGYSEGTYCVRPDTGAAAGGAVAVGQAGRAVHP